jgi:hypothetical protein
MLLPQVIIETKAETILKVLQMGTVCRRVFDVPFQSSPDRIAR